jgi:glycerol-3-phosphate dehydrogenase (NAD(P)+)
LDGLTGTHFAKNVANFISLTWSEPKSRLESEQNLAERKHRIGVLGGGSWATAIVKMLSENCNNVFWWMRNEAAAEYIIEYRHNPNYLQSVEIQTDIVAVTTDLEEVVEECDILIIAIPAAFLNAAFENPPEGLKDKIIFSAIKGIVPEYGSIPARFFHKRFGTPYDNLGIVGGPCHAEEVALEKLSYLTLACPSLHNAKIMADALACRYMRTSTSEDLFGTEISAVLKNIYAVASGICHGVGYGDNFQAVLVANAICEIERFVDAVNPVHRDVKSSAYLGDLMVTAYSPYSRNRTFGNMIGKGLSVKAAQFEMNMVAEGYYAAKSIHEMNKKYGVDMPIANMVYNILYEKISPIIEIQILTTKLT